MFTHKSNKSMVLFSDLVWLVHGPFLWTILTNKNVSVVQWIHYIIHYTTVHTVWYPWNKVQSLVLLSLVSLWCPPLFCFSVPFPSSECVKTVDILRLYLFVSRNIDTRQYVSYILSLTSHFVRYNKQRFWKIHVVQLSRVRDGNTQNHSWWWGGRGSIGGTWEREVDMRWEVCVNFVNGKVNGIVLNTIDVKVDTQGLCPWRRCCWF